MSKSSDSKPAIVVKGITKTFKIPTDTGRSVKNKILGRAGKGYREFTPLNDISFTVYEGDFFGIVGRNGSGKSTLLKTIAGIYEPTAGRVRVNGTLVPFIELGVGFNPNLTGRENVYLNAAMLGFSRPEISDMYDEIVDFAELHDFMDERLQNYSSGMQVRLAFSIAIRARGDVLLLDEVLAVGDKAFQQKCYDYFDQLKKDKKTVILVTHSMDNVERFCNRGLLLNNGEIETIGSSDEVADSYRKLFGKVKSADTTNNSRVASTEINKQNFKSVNLSLIDTSDNIVSAHDPIKISLDMLPRLTFDKANVTVVMKNIKDVQMLSFDYSGRFGETPSLVADVATNIKLEIDNIYTNGQYYFELIISALGENGKEIVYKQNSICRLTIEGIESHYYSLTHPQVRIVKD